jgi:UDP-galactopyranose mutase
MFAKIVKEEFKESHRETYGIPDDPLEVTLVNMVFNKARFHKGIQRLKDNGEYTETMKDMGKLLSVIVKDVEEESLADVAAYLVGKFWPQAKKSLNQKIITRYKQHLGMGTAPTQETNNESR